MTDVREPGGGATPDAAANRTTESTPGGTQDQWPNRIGVLSLGVVAVLCIIALGMLSNLPQPPGTAEPSASQGVQPTAAGPVAAQVAGDTGSLGSLGQVVGVLGTIATAAVGGISGMLTSRSGGGEGPASGLSGIVPGGDRPGGGGGA